MKKGKNILMTFVVLIMITSVGTASLTIKNSYYFQDTNSSDSIDMLIFLSPQYAHNIRIIHAINKYCEAVKTDIDWNIKILTINPCQNDFQQIDKIIENYYENYTIKACMMVGEDIDTAKGADWDYNEAPSTAPWYTIGGENSYYIDENGDISIDNPHKMDICISLVYPTSTLSYFRKSMQIISVFNKFSKNRDIDYNGKISVFAGSREVHCNRSIKDVYESMDRYGDLYYKEDPNLFEIIKSLTGSYSIYCISGHSNPSKTCVNEEKNRMFYANYLTLLDTPFFTASGCYVEGWWSDYEDNNVLDPSIRRIWYGSKIFNSQHIRAMVLGFPDQAAGGPGDPYYNFIVNAIPDLTSGRTLAESMIGHTFFYSNDSTVYGDPTFHYTVS